MLIFEKINFSKMQENIRQAKTEDAHLVAPLIVQAMGDLAGDFVGSEQIEEAIPLFEKLFALTENQYSHDHTLVYEEEGEILGSITAYKGENLYEYRRKLMQIIEDEYQITGLHLEDETQAGEFYLDTLSVSPNAQGKGIGTKLIKAMIKKAIQESHSRVGLLVDKENPHAKRLYERLGFQVIKTVRLVESDFEHMQILL